MYADGCHLNPPETEVPECVYGNPSSKTTVVLFGDSHAMQWFPAFFWGGWGSQITRSSLEEFLESRLETPEDTKTDPSGRLERKRQGKGDGERPSESSAPSTHWGE